MDIISKHLNKIIQKRSSSWIFFVFFLFAYFFYWGRRILLYGPTTFGYDIGIYRRLFLEYQNIEAFILAPHATFAVIPAFFIHTLHIPVDWILLGGYCLTILFFAFAVVQFFRSFNITPRFIPFISSILVLIHPITLQFIADYYFRNLLAISLLLLLIAYQKKLSAPLIILMSIILTMTHPLMAVFSGIVLLILFLFQKSFQKLFLFFSIGSLFTAALMYPELWGYVEELQKFSREQELGIVSNEVTGQFFSQSSLYPVILLLIPCIILHIWKQRSRIFLPLYTIGTVSTIWFIAELPFFRRVIPLLIIVGIPLAISGAWYFYNSLKKPISTIFFCSYCLVCITLGVSHAQLMQPKISPVWLNEVQQVQTQPGDAVFAYNSTVAPWVHGYIPNAPTIAPGLFEYNPWNYWEWQYFWNHPEKHQELLQIFQEEYTRLIIVLPPDPRFRKSETSTTSLYIRYFEL